MEEQLGNRAPHLAFEVEHAVQDVVAEVQQAAMQMRPLAARGAERAVQRSAAIEALAAVRRRSFFARRAFDGARDDRARQHVACCFPFPAHGAKDSTGVL